jgi:hypothetical protein
MGSGEEGRRQDVPGHRRGFFRLVAGTAATTVIPTLWRSCKNVNARYPHGVGKRFAHDKTTGVPVTNFRRSALLYLRAMSYNKRLDRDKDGIA